MSEYEAKFYRLLQSALSALEKIPVRSRASEQKYCVEQIEKELQLYRRRVK